MTTAEFDECNICIQPFTPFSVKVYPRSELAGFSRYALREYDDDTEDYINIMLDDKQNHLLQMGVMLTTATLVVICFVVVVGVFGMNFGIKLFKEEVQAGMSKFLWTVAGGTTGSMFLYLIAIAWCKHRRLLDN
ncbi:hypothetical protein H0E87_001288 [Populus deltoides]|uniref:Uncharacterized protein n=1 Tax=Populus deltoides TaxID=3696 RepID=A0A8T2ZR65_POPDE|nr:hypothetical protein H0E87_001288 [Populus deltoides]